MTNEGDAYKIASVIRGFPWEPLIYLAVFPRLCQGKSAERAAFQQETHRRMAKGTVKWFNDAKGFGFIEQESGGEDVFVHYSTIQTDGYRSLKEGQKVEYEVEGADKGLRATNVRATSEAPESVAAMS